jgi:uncharacterized repeat protein (TIGR01451 family)
VNLTGAPTTTASILPRPLTITGISAASKPYDGTTTATLLGTPQYAGLAPGDVFAVVGVPIATFATAAVGTNISVSVSGFLAPTTNYTLTPPTGFSANITPREVRVDGRFQVADKPYDGTRNATIIDHALTLLGALDGDDVQLVDLVPAFDTPSVGDGKPVSILSARLSGPSAANYRLSQGTWPTTSARIFAAQPPSAPSAVTGNPGDGSITVQWTVPTMPGCGPIVAYRVEYSRDAGSTWSHVTVSQPTTVLQGLTNHVPYWIRVAAINACGQGAFSDMVGPLVPFGPTLRPTGRPPASPPGSASGTSSGTSRDVTVDVVRDSIVRLTDGSVTLTLGATDEDGGTLAVDSTRTVQLEQGGHTTSGGAGFAPQTMVSLYIYAATGEPILLGHATVRTDGTFEITTPIPAALPPGPYTIQVNGIDAAGLPRSVALGVTVAAPPAELVLTAVASEAEPAVGDTITITLTVTNEGRGPAIDVVIPRAFDEPGLRIVAASPVHGTYHAVHHTWRIARIEAGASAQLHFTVIVLAPVSAPEGTP